MENFTIRRTDSGCIMDEVCLPVTFLYSELDVLFFSCQIAPRLRIIFWMPARVEGNSMSPDSQAGTDEVI